MSWYAQSLFTYGTHSVSKEDFLRVYKKNSINKTPDMSEAALKDYLEPGGSLEGFEQFGKPIWLTEFSCDGTATAAAQETFMRAAIPYLESNPHVFRYSWFSASPIPNAVLVNSDGSPTALGQVYAGLAQSCP